MSGYQLVNYYELCRLCTTSEGNKMYIFRDEGRRQQLQTKIQTCLPIQVLEEDSLPKMICQECIKKMEHYLEFRQAVLNAETMLESYFTSLRYSEDFLKEGKVYVKSCGKTDKPDAPPIKSSKTTVNRMNDEPIQHQQPVVVSNITAPNLIISEVQSRVQQYKCAMQMQGGMAAAVVEATAETHYSYQQQTSQVSPQQANESQNQIQGHGQMNQQIQSRQINQSAQQILQSENQTQNNQQLQQLQQRQQRELQKQHRLQQIDKQQVQITSQQQFSDKQDNHSPVLQQNNNIVLKTEEEDEQNQILQKVQVEIQKSDNSPNIQRFTNVQASPEVFLNLGFKESSLTTQSMDEDSKEFKNYVKSSPEDAITRNSMGQISEFLKIRSTPEQAALITTEIIAPATRANIVCADCGKSFNAMTQMNDHTCSPQTMITDSSPGNKEDTLQSSNSSPFNCDVCNKPFRRKEHLYQHRKLHTGERPYVCTTCSKSFSRKEHLVRHLVSHTGQKMHECEMCGKSFSRKDNLHKHRKIHGVSGPFNCETCGKSFIVKHYYLMHITTHASNSDSNNGEDPLPYKCDICDKAFSVKQYLTTHKLRHRSRSNNSSAHNNLNGHQQQTQQTSQSNSVDDVNAVGSNSVNPNNGQTDNDSSVEMESVIERSESTNGSFTNSQYHNNIQEFQ